MDRSGSAQVPSGQSGSFAKVSGRSRSQRENLSRFSETAVTSFLARGRSVGEASRRACSRPERKAQSRVIHAPSPRQTEPSSAMTTNFSSGANAITPGNFKAKSGECRGTKWSGK